MAIRTNLDQGSMVYEIDELEKVRAQELVNRLRPRGVNSITIDSPLRAGQSGANVWLVDVQSDRYNGRAIAKFDEPDRLTREATRAEDARKYQALERRVPKVLTVPQALPKSEEGGNAQGVGFMLLEFAQHRKADHVLSLRDHLSRQGADHRELVQEQVTAVVQLIAKWYGSAGWNGNRVELDVPATFRRLLAIDGKDRLARLDERMQDHFGLSSDMRRLVIDSGSPFEAALTLENPAHILAHAGSWAGLRLRVAVCPMHGDLHGGNVICQVTRFGDRKVAPPQLIDFANFDPEGVFFYDLAQLEFDILSHYLPHTSDQEWRDWHHVLTFACTALAPAGEPPGERAPHAWELIKPIRDAVGRYVRRTARETDGGIHVDLERAWWLAVATVGTRAAQRSKNPPGVRSAGLVYASLALRHLPHGQIRDEAVATLRWYPKHGLRATEPKDEGSTSVRERARRSGPKLFTPHTYEGMGNAFIGRGHELEALNRWARSDDRLIEVVAIGGQGKSALAWEWFTKYAAGVIPEFAGGMWWSFYESDGAIRHCLAVALQLLGGRSADEVAKLTRAEQEDALVELCQTQPLLIVFDGTERLLKAYHTWRFATRTDEEVDGQLTDSDAAETEHPRGCVNPQDGALLRRLARAGAARVLVTSRLPIDDLRDNVGAVRPGVVARELPGLSDGDVIELFRHYRIKGDEWRIVDFARSFQSHGLLITLIAGRIRAYPRARGNFDRWYRDEGEHLDLRSLDLRQRQNHILRFALEALSQDARALLRRLAVYNYPFGFDEAMAIHPFAERHYVRPDLPQPPFPEEEVRRKTDAESDADDEYWDAPHNSHEEADALARRDALRRELDSYRDWQEECNRLDRAARLDSHLAAERDVGDALAELEERGLLAYDFGRGKWDMHPVVRGYAYGELGDDPDGRRAALVGKRDYFESRATTPPDQVNDLDDLRPELELYDALLQAGEFDRASTFFGERLRHLLHSRLAAYHEIVRLLTPLFSEGLDRPPDLTEPEQQSKRITSLAEAFGWIDGEEETRLNRLGVRFNLDRRLSRPLFSSIVGLAIRLSYRNLHASATLALQLGLRLATAADYRYGVFEAQSMLLGEYIALGWWAEAAAVRSTMDLEDLKDVDADSRAISECFLKASDAEIAVARGETAGELLDEAERLARTSRDAQSLRRVLEARGDAAMAGGSGDLAVRHFQRWLELRQAARLDVKDTRGRLALALLLIGDRDGARDQVEAGADSLSTAEVMLALGEVERAEQAGLVAYSENWGEGAPYTDAHLPRAEAVLKALDVPIPQLPPFDLSRVQHLPEEDRIIAFIEELEAKR